MLDLNEKLDLWVKITGVNPNEHKTSYTIKLDGKLSDYDIEKMNNKILEALSYDETGLFAESYLKVFFTQYLKNKDLSLYELITNNNMSDYIRDIKTLYKALIEDDAETVAMEEAKKIMDFYNLSMSELNLSDIAELRTSANNCINGTLKTIQLSRGNTGDEFKASKNIVMYKDINALITCAAKGSINGVSLAYIRNDKQITDSYFAFVIKNGDNLWLLTDMPEYSHPLQNKMSRCPGRNMSRRIESNLFPYESVANIDTSDLWNKGRYGASEKSTELSTSIHDDDLYTIIGTLDTLLQDEAFWTVMMFSLIKDKFYTNKVPELPISYAGYMVNSPLLDKSETSLIVRNALPTICIDEINISDTKGLKYQTEYYKFDDENNYIMLRYKDKVDTNFLNIINETDKYATIEEKYAIKDVWGEKVGCEYAALDLSIPRTEEKLHYDQKWIARYNYAKEINKLLQEDCQNNLNAINNTINGYISKRLEELIIMHLQGKLIGHRIISNPNGFGMIYEDEPSNLGKMYDLHKFYNDRSLNARYTYGYDRYTNYNDIKCAFTGKSASIIFHIEPQNANDLALICGIPVNDLPELIRNYEKKDKYYGNNILDNIDPMLWGIKDPFNKIDFDINICISKTMYKTLCNKAGVAYDKFWENEKPECYTDKYNMHKCEGKYTYDTDTHCHVLLKKCRKCKWRK